VPTFAISTADKRVQSTTSVDPSRGASSIDVWIGSRVRVKRTSRGMTQQEFSTLLGIDWNELDAFEIGAERINANLLFRIAKLLAARPDYFFRGYIERNLRVG
jgi:hypothetical protein